MARWRPQPQGAIWVPGATDHLRREGLVQRAWCGKGKLRPFWAGPGVHCKDALPTRRAERGSSWAGPVPNGGVSKHLRWQACHPVCGRTGPQIDATQQEKLRGHLTGLPCESRDADGDEGARTRSPT